MIQKYFDVIGINGKSFVLCAITPKGHYPLKSYGKEFDNYVNQIFGNKEKYIGLFDTVRSEILQDVAFKIYTLPLIGDSYSIREKKLEKVERASKNQMEAFMILKEFYSTVPYGKLNEEEAIKSGLEKGQLFTEKYSSKKYDVVIKNVGRHEEGTQILYDMEFDCENRDYVFDYCYCY